MSGLQLGLSPSIRFIRFNRHGCELLERIKRWKQPKVGDHTETTRMRLTAETLQVAAPTETLQPAGRGHRRV